MQIVYISNRPQLLLQTMRHVATFMPWIDTAVVAAPGPTHHQIEDAAPLPVTLFDDETLTGSTTSDLAALDHASRNVTIRRALVATDAVDAVFIQSDDDYRPIRPVGQDDLVTPDGRLVSYWCHDLAAWTRDETDHDRCLHTSYQALAWLEVGHLNFASHMPQAMDRSIWLEAVDEVTRLAGTHQVCEWSVPHNYGRSVHPERFAPVRPYRTLGWPQFPLEWPQQVAPGPYAFENFHPEQYEPGHLYHGLPTEPVDGWEQVGFEKVMRRYRLEMAVANLRVPPGVWTPWTATPVRRAVFGVLRRLKWVRDYLRIGDRRPRP